MDHPRAAPSVPSGSSQIRSFQGVVDELHGLICAGPGHVDHGNQVVDAAFSWLCRSNNRKSTAPLVDGLGRLWVMGSAGTIEQAVYRKSAEILQKTGQAGAIARHHLLQIVGDCGIASERTLPLARACAQDVVEQRVPCAPWLPHVIRDHLIVQGVQDAPLLNTCLQAAMAGHDAFAPLLAVAAEPPSRTLVMAVRALAQRETDAACDIIARDPVQGARAMTWLFAQQSERLLRADHDLSERVREQTRMCHMLSRCAIPGLRAGMELPHMERWSICTGGSSWSEVIQAQLLGGTNSIQSRHAVGITLAGPCARSVRAGLGDRGEWRNAAVAAGDAWHMHEQLSATITSQAWISSDGIKAMMTGLDRGWFRDASQSDNSDWHAITTLIDGCKTLLDSSVMQVAVDGLYQRQQTHAWARQVIERLRKHEYIASGAVRILMRDASTTQQ